MKGENCLTHHAKFLIKELLATFDIMEEEDLNDKELQQLEFDLKERLP